MGRRRERATAFAIAFALVTSPLSATLCGAEPSEKARECCKDRIHCNTLAKRDACCNPEGQNQTGDGSAAVATSAKQKSFTDYVLPGHQPSGSAPIAVVSGMSLLADASDPLPHCPLIKPLRI